ncbi:MAG TPA: EF-hand domain-containing protein [Syntrophorhabdaceae bacterium]|mgnify:CR=1 FL=1|nr:EF-hand domain-containing protein [Syntrophorhabdaceae bacterium]HQM80731.1 EF-hand domain-containing protein [Syntrophorhabdaceae bacterium]
MKKILILGLFGAASMIAALFAMAGENPAASQQGLKVVSDASDKSSATPKERYFIRVKTRSAVDVTGSVIHIDWAAKSITLKGKGKTITFDMVNPSFIGYTDLDEIKKGDTVTISYKKGGLQIRKGLPPAATQTKTAHAGPGQARPPEQNKTVQKAMKQKASDAASGQSKKPSLKTEAKKPQKTASIRTKPVRLRDRPMTSEFRDVDNNKDGKVSAVELSVIFPDLTLQQFREYDKNRDGVLDEQEFRAAKRSR